MMTCSERLRDLTGELHYQIEHETLPDDPAQRRLVEGRRCHEFASRAGEILVNAVAEGALPSEAIEGMCQSPNAACLIAIQRWLPTRVPGFKFQLGRHGSVAHEYLRAMKLLAEQLANPSEFRDAKWFSHNTDVPAARLRQAASRRAVRVQKSGKRVLYSMRDAIDLWPDDMEAKPEA
jgi:hypothetical protein